MDFDDARTVDAPKMNRELPDTDASLVEAGTDARSVDLAKGFDGQTSLEVIDAFRGYAILLVIGVHSVGHIPNLVWPAKRVMQLGFYGVQLFFIASALTLMMSWHRSRDAFGTRSFKFIIRRFFRIAPLYYLAIPFYWYAYQVDSELFKPGLLFASLFFVNAWSPYWIPTVPGWTPVPGGWSIGVEFCFYFLFPLAATMVKDLKAAIMFFVAALAITFCASYFSANLYPEISLDARENFLYFWPPNQLVIFSLGFIIFHIVTNMRMKEFIEKSGIDANHATIGALLLFLGLAFTNSGKFFDLSSGWPPRHFLASLVFAAWAAVLVIRPNGFAINKFVSGLGKVSFSAYIFHFAVLKYVGLLFALMLPGGASGFYSVLYGLFVFLLSVILTRVLSELTYKNIELPFQRIGKGLICRFAR